MKKKIISLTLILIIVPIISIAQYYEVLDKISGKGIIAEPIVIVENMQEKTEVNFDKTTIKEYSFKIKNYNSEQRISEIDFNYNIEIIKTDNNFPVKIELYEVSTNKEILKGRNKTDNLILAKNIKTEIEYKLIIKWNNQEVLGNQADINILVNASQKNHNI